MVGLSGSVYWNITVVCWSLLSHTRSYFDKTKTYHSQKHSLSIIYMYSTSTVQHCTPPPSTSLTTTNLLPSSNLRNIVAKMSDTR